MKRISIHSLFYFLSRFKYYIVLVLGELIIGVVDENSFMRRFEYANQIEDMKAEIKKYNNQYRHDMELLNNMKLNPTTIAKIARERYFMKTDDEDIFVLSDDENPVENESQNETTE